MATIHYTHVATIHYTHVATIHCTGLPVDAGGGKLFLGEETGQVVSITFGLHKHQRSVGTWGEERRKEGERREEREEAVGSEKIEGGEEEGGREEGGKGGGSGE